MRKLLTVLVLFQVLPVLSSAADVWPRFRGPEGHGRSDEKGLPLEITDKTRRWEVALPGAGDSSPVVWKELVFVSSFADDGSTRYLSCLHRDDGRTLWQKKISAAPHHLHKKNSYAVTTPCVDAERIYMSYASGDNVYLRAWDHSGKELWTYSYGAQSSMHGFGSSPAIADGVVLLSLEQMSRDPDGVACSLKGIRAEDGTLAWELPMRSTKVSYITPSVRHAKDGARLYLSSMQMGLYCVAASSGKLLWKAPVLDQRTVGSPQLYKDLVIASCGSGGRGSIMAAIRDGGTGDVSGSHEAYRSTTGAPYVSTPLVVGDRMYFWSDRGGMLRCMNPATGKLIWSGRAGGDVSGSPVYADGHIYMIDEAGTLIVIRDSDRLELVSQSPIGARSFSTPAIAEGRIYLRAGRILLSVGHP